MGGKAGPNGDDQISIDTGLTRGVRGKPTGHIQRPGRIMKQPPRRQGGQQWCANMVGQPNTGGAGLSHHRPAPANHHRPFGRGDQRCQFVHLCGIRMNAARGRHKISRRRHRDWRVTPCTFLNIKRHANNNRDAGQTSSRKGVLNLTGHAWLVGDTHIFGAASDNKRRLVNILIVPVRGYR